MLKTNWMPNSGTLLLNTSLMVLLVPGLTSAQQLQSPLDNVYVSDRISSSSLIGQPPGWTDNFRYSNVEQYLQRGNEHIRQQNYQEAEVEYAMAVQIYRTSSGLYDPGQFALIDKLLAALLLQGNWQDFDQQLAYLSFLNQKLTDHEPEQLAERLVNQSDWYRSAAASITDSQSAWYLIRAKYLNWRAVNVLVQGYGPNDMRLVPVLYRIVIDHYYQTVMSQRQRINSFEYKTDGKEIANGWSLTKNENTQRSFRIGLENLQRIRAIYRQSSSMPAQLDALTLINIADWHLLYGYSDLASGIYGEAYQALTASGIEVEEVERYFNKLVILPEMKVPSNWQASEKSDNESSVNFQAWSKIYPGAQRPFNLSFQDGSANLDSSMRATVEFKLNLQQSELSRSKGLDYRVTGLNIVEYRPDNEEALTRIFSEIPLLQFRPRLAGGQFVNHEPAILNYFFAP